MFPAIVAARLASPSIIAMTSEVCRAMWVLDENIEVEGNGLPILETGVLETASLETRWLTTRVKVVTFEILNFHLPRHLLRNIAWI